MPYTKNPPWNDNPVGGTPITAAKLNHIEDGVEAAAATADTAATTATSAAGTVTAAQTAANNAQSAANNAQTAANANASKSLLMAKGDMLVATGPGALVRVPVGADGRQLEADSTQAAGVKWGRKFIVSETTPAGALAGDLWIKPNPIASRFSVVDGRIYEPSGIEFVGAGMNVAANITGTASWAPNSATVWSHNGLPPFDIEHDVWPGHLNYEAAQAPTQQWPGGGVNSCNAWSQSKLGFYNIPDRVYAMTGFRTASAIALGIAAPADNWHTRYARIPCFFRPHAETWNGADLIPSVQNLIDQYIAAANELANAGMVVTAQHHAFTGQNPVMPSNFVADPTLPATQTPLDNEIRDTLKFLDAVVDNCDPAQFLLELPNETHTTRRTTTYDDWVVTLIRRVRARGWQGVIIVPTGGWNGDLAGLAAGNYNTLMDRLDSHGVGWGLAWSWHNYGAHWLADGSDIVNYEGATGYSAIVSQLTACRNGVGGRKFAVIMGEYGQPTPFQSDSAMIGTLETRARSAVDLMAGTTFGPRIGALFPHIIPTWWNACGDATFVRRFSLTTGLSNKNNDNGTDPYNSANQNPPGSMPFWDITSPALATEWCSAGGLKHWNLTHAIAAL